MNLRTLTASAAEVNLNDRDPRDFSVSIYDKIHVKERKVISTLKK